MKKKAKAKKKGFSEPQESFITYLAQGKTEEESAKLAWGPCGYAKGKQYNKNKELVMVKEAVQHAMQKEFQMSRSEVLAGIKEAVELAMRSDDPNTAIRGYVELAKLLGYSVPEKKQIEHIHRADLQELPSDELAARAGHKKAINLDESQWEEVDTPTKEDQNDKVPEVQETATGEELPN